MTSKIMIINIYTIWAVIVADCTRTKRMIGGTKVLCGEQLRVASICKSIDLKHLCGSVLLSARTALTAAHCVLHQPKDYILVLDNYCTDNTIPPTAEVLQIYRHYLYDKYSGAHDIALLSINLAVDEVHLFGDSILPKSLFGLSGTCSTYGYRVDHDTISKDLMHAHMTIVSLDQCLASLGPYVAPDHDSGMLCAVGDGADPCQGDSGSPLMCEGLVEGVSSYGLACGVPGVPGVFTSVAAHSRWIRDIINSTMNHLS